MWNKEKNPEFLQIKNTKSKIKNILDETNVRLDRAEEISELEAIETIQN